MVYNDTVKCTIRLNVDVEANGGVVLVKGIDFGEHNLTGSDLHPYGVHNITDVLDIEEETKYI